MRHSFLRIDTIFDVRRMPACQLSFVVISKCNQWERTIVCVRVCVCLLSHMYDSMSAIVIEFVSILPSQAECIAFAASILIVIDTFYLVKEKYFPSNTKLWPKLIWPDVKCKQDAIGPNIASFNNTLQHGNLFRFPSDKNKTMQAFCVVRLGNVFVNLRQYEQVFRLFRIYLHFFRSLFFFLRINKMFSWHLPNMEYLNNEQKLDKRKSIH